MGLAGKDLLGMRELTVDEIRLILDTAESMKEVARRDIKKVPALRGKTLINLFYESSTRTRTSFEIAGKWLSADVTRQIRRCPIIACGSAATMELEWLLREMGVTAFLPDVIPGSAFARLCRRQLGLPR